MAVVMAGFGLDYALGYCREFVHALLGDRCRIERPGEYTQDAEGHALQNWQTLALCDCDVQHGSGGGMWNRNREEGKQGARIFIPLDTPEVEGGRAIDSSCRVIRESTGMVYQVLGAAQPDSDDLALTITVQLPSEESRND